MIGKEYWENKIKEGETELAFFKESYKGGCITCNPEFRKIHYKIKSARQYLAHHKNESSVPIQSEPQANA